MYLDLGAPQWGALPELKRLQNEMNRLFNVTAQGADEFPAVNLWSNEDKLVLTAELPGVSPEDLNVSVLGNQLTIEGEKKLEPAGEKAVYHRRERTLGKFTRTMRLPYEVDSDKVCAKFANGVLVLELPRIESQKPRKIAINS